MRMIHLALLDDWLRLSCGAPRARGRHEIGGGELTPDIEFEFARQLDDGFGMMPVLEQRVFDGLGAVDEQAAIEAVLFLRDPVAALVLANEDDGRCRATRGRFDELHARYPSVGEYDAVPDPPIGSVAAGLAVGLYA